MTSGVSSLDGQAEALRRCEETAEAQSEAKMEMDNVFGRLEIEMVICHISFFIYTYIHAQRPRQDLPYIYMYIYIYYIYVTRDPFRSSQTSRRTQERYPPEALGILGFLTTNPGIPHLKTI